MDLFERLRNEPDLYYAYQANIAMAFKDQFEIEALKDTDIKNINYMMVDKNLLHKIANQAAKNFLDLLIKPIENEQPIFLH